MVRSILFWLIALFVTIASAVFQRLTGPTYPVRGRVVLQGEEIAYKFYRSHDVGDCLVYVATKDTSIIGNLFYRPYKSDEPYRTVPMSYESGGLKAYLPHQPPAGKLHYHVELRRAGETIRVPEAEDVRIRFTGQVPRPILLLHILFMFLAMLVSARAGLAALARSKHLKAYTLWSTALIFIGGFLFGALVQKYAFGVYWSGVPFGIDLTDNKTLIALIAWLSAIWALVRQRPLRPWVLAAAVITLLIFLIPHSLLGS